MRNTTIAAALMLQAAILPDRLSAQLVTLLPERPVQPVVTIPAGSVPALPPVASPAKGGPLEVIVLKPARPPWLLTRLLPQNDMTGWAPLTEGAAHGGISVARIPGGPTHVVLRGADDVLYTATIGPDGPVKPVAAAAWQSLGITAASEPDCQPVAGFTSFGCAWLGAAGDARYVILGGGNGVQGMGGSKASGRPALAALAMTSANNTMQTSVRMLVLGNGTMFRRAQTSLATVAGTQTTDDSGWTKMSGRFVTSARCDQGQCAYVRTGGYLGLGDPFDEMPGGSAAPLPGGWSASAPVPVKLASGRYAVVARSANGRVYRTVVDGGRFAAWVDEGGTTMDGAGLACIANGERPLCFAQALDGRIYGKLLGSAAGE